MGDGPRERSSLDILQQLEEERDRLRGEERKVVGKIVGTRSKIASVRAQLESSRKTRDGLTETVRALKKTRDELRESARKSLAGLRGLGRVGSSVGSRAEQELARLEWMVQTSTLAKEEEKQLMAKIRVVESRVGTHRKTQQFSENITKYRNEADELHAKIQQLAAESQTHHGEILTLRGNLDALNTKLEEERKVLDDIRQRLSEVNRKYGTLRDEAKAVERISRAEKEKAYKESLKETAKRKLDQREKVSLEELGAFLGDEE